MNSVKCTILRKKFKLKNLLKTKVLIFNCNRGAADVFLMVKLIIYWLFTDYFDKKLIVSVNNLSFLVQLLFKRVGIRP